MERFAAEDWILAAQVRIELIKEARGTMNRAPSIHAELFWPLLCGYQIELR
jgi:hypothetical protein